MKDLIEELSCVKLQLHNQRTGFGDTTFLKLAEKHLDKALRMAARSRMEARASKRDPETGTFKKPAKRRR